MSKPRALVTGGSGFVGANLARRLLRDGHEVHLLLRPSYRAWRIEDILDHCHAHLCELADEEAVRSTLATVRPEWVFHLAVYGAYPHQNEDGKILRENIAAVVHLVQACRFLGVGTLINTGSSSEYGPKDHAPHEGESTAPISAYGVSKVATTQYCAFAAQRFGLPISTLRLYSTFGPQEEPSRLLPTLLRNAVAGRWPPLADPRSAHDFIYVDDVVEAYLQAARGPGQPLGAIYNIGSGVQSSLLDVVEAARALTQITAEPAWGTMPSRSWDMEVWVADITRARELLQWSPRYSLAEGLAATLAWMEQTGRMGS
jgi:nucleoside-diphosphate-sugar epimerase